MVSVNRSWCRQPVLPRGDELNLFSKIYSSLLAGMLGLLVLVGNWHYETQLSQFDQNFTGHGKELAVMVAQTVAAVWREQGREEAMRHLDQADPGEIGVSLRWLSEEEAREQLARWYDPDAGTVGPRQLLASAVVAFDEPRDITRHFLVPLVGLGDGQGVLEVSRPLAPLAEFAQKILVQSLVVTGILALIGSVVTYWLIYSKIRRPLEKLSRKAIEIGKGNLSADLEIKGDDELVHLAGIMNDMCTRLLIAQEKIHFENLARLKTLEQLRHTEKLSTIGQIAAGIAHEIGTPLNVVDGRAKMILNEPLKREEIIGCARIIKTQAERMTLIIRQLLDYSRKRKSSPKECENVVTLIRQVFHLLAPLAGRQGVALQLEARSEIRVFCLVDGQQIQQVLMNVIMNGIQATAVGGMVLVEVTNMQLKSRLRTEDELRHLLRIDIRDEGGGIALELLEEIFTPFFTTKSVGLGTGLGLSIARELLEEHGGWIEVRNRPIKGAEFSLYLPLQEKDGEGPCADR
jgi:two-component system, NtrC family, sensor kinase